MPTLPDVQMDALKAAATPKAVIWPRQCKAVRQYATGTDGRVHFEAPIDDAFALYNAGFINGDGTITAAGRAQLPLWQEIDRLTARNAELRAAVAAALACTTLSDQSNAIVLDAKTVEKLRVAL